MRFRVLIVLLIVIFGLNRFKSQVNLVPNPSFETYTACPNSLGEIYKALYWDQFNGSPDYFNPCSTISSAGAPNNGFGYQLPSSGDSYAGLITYYNAYLYREFLGVQLTTTLTISQKYFFSFMMCRGSDNLFVGYSTNKIGVKFTKVKSYPNNINNSAHFYINNVITDTLNWVKVFGSFVADSNYQYLIIGNFFDDSNTNITNQTGGIYAYYYIDDVCLSTDSTFCSEYSTSVREFNKTNELQLFPNPANSALQINGIEEGPVLITTIFGEVIESKNKFENKSIIINTSNYPEGLYFVKTKNTMLKLIINH